MTSNTKKKNIKIKRRKIVAELVLFAVLVVKLVER